MSASEWPVAPGWRATHPLQGGRNPRTSQAKPHVAVKNARTSCAVIRKTRPKPGHRGNRHLDVRYRVQWVKLTYCCCNSSYYGLTDGLYNTAGASRAVSRVRTRRPCCRRLAPRRSTAGPPLSRAPRCARRPRASPPRSPAAPPRNRAPRRPR